MTFLGIDLGTSGLRALLVDVGGKPIGASEQSYAVKRPHQGWCEQDPADWINALNAAVHKLRDTYPEFSALRGIAVSGHMHGATLLDKSGQVLRPCILWNDTRADRQAQQLDHMAQVRDLSGNIVFAGFTAPKLLWLRENEPHIFSLIYKVLLPAAYVNYYLCGDYIMDRSDAAGTAWLDIKTRQWSPALLQAGQMRPDQMPDLVDGTAPAGQLRADLLRDWGVQGPVTIAGGAGDNAAAACGIGALSDGQGFVSLGTSGVILAARKSCQPAPETAVHTFCHAIPDCWYQMGVMLSATDCLNWLSRITGDTPAALTAALGDTLRAPSSVGFLPYLSGERTPHNDAHIRGSFIGLSARSTRESLTHAVLTGVAFGLRDSLSALQNCGAEFDQMFAIGGGAASRYWLQLMATVLDTPLALPAGQEYGAAMGAARMAITAATGTAVEQVMRAPDVQDIITPQHRHKAAYDEAYEKFKASYHAVKAVQ